MEDWRTYAAQRYKAKQVNDRFKLAEGENCVRILPRKQINKEGKVGFGGPPFHEFLQHQQVGPKQRYLTCGHDINGVGSCYICDQLIPKLKNSTNKALRARAAALEPKELFYVQIVFLDDEQKFRGPLPWSVSAGGKKSLATQILGVLKSTKRDYISLKNGYNLNIERTGTGFKDTRYGSIITDEEPSEVPRELVLKMKTFDELIPAYNADEQKAAYEGKEVTETDDEEYGSVDEEEAAAEEAPEERSWDEVQEDVPDSAEDVAEPEETVDEEVAVEEEETVDTTDDDFESVFDLEEEPPKKKQPAAPAPKAPAAKPKQAPAPPAKAGGKKK